MVRLLTISLLMCICHLQAQDTLEVVKASGPSQSFVVANITKITFTATDMVINGPGQSIPINTILLLLFHTDPLPVEEANGRVPFTFESISPNPCNPSTSLKFGLVRPGAVSVQIIGANGKRVRQLFSGRKEAGQYECTWDGRDDSGLPAASGVYQVLLNVDNKTAVKRAVLVR